MNIVQAINDPKVFGRYFKAESWTAWRAFLAALFGLPLTHDQLLLYRQFTGRKGSVQNLSHFRFWLSGARPWLTR